MENKVYYVSKEQMDDIREALKKNDSLFIAEINGTSIQSLQDYLNTVSEIFMFPIPSRNLDGYLDWIRDLDWLNKDGYVLVINDYSNFINNDLSMKNRIIGKFDRLILPWWQDEVEKCVVEGKAKPFNVYLVD